jgi:flagellar protein FlbT
MSLKLNLRPGESLLIGRAKITNGGDKRCILIVSGEENMLRENLLLLEKDATTPVKRLYFVVQGIYLSEKKEELFPLYFDMVRAVVDAYPFLVLHVTDVSQMILEGRYYDAVNRCHALIGMESEILDRLPKEAV